MSLAASLRPGLVIATVSACLLSAGCGGGGSSTSTVSTNSTTTGTNVASITVNGGLQGNYPDAAFTSVTVCVPGSSTCQTIDDVLVDTGSSGLRILASALTISLPQQKASNGDSIAECVQFLGSYTWGPVQTADVQIAGETASSLPIQVLSDSDFSVPSSCSSVGPSADNQESLGANGIIGVGVFPQDCGGACIESVTNTTPPANAYYECASPTAACQSTFENASLQVQNPVVLFSSDNNGVIIELPALSGAETSVSGSLIFGIGTQSNNGLGTATVYTVDPNTGNFNTTFTGTDYNDASFIDSGSNGYFFADSSIAQCPSNGAAPGFYCPASTVNLSAINSGITAGSGTVNFSIANAETLFSNSSDFAFNDLGGGPVGGSASYFDWGLPFFFGRNVYTAIDGSDAPGGNTPYWAY